MSVRAPFALLLLIVPLARAIAADPPATIHETFDAFDPARFDPPIPNKYSEVRNGALWTRGSTGTAYPPMVFLPIQGKDVDIAFRYRHLGEGGWVWFLVDGDDGHGSTDHVFRVKLLRDRVELQVDAHSLDANHPLRQPRREADPVSKTYRLNEILPAHKIDLSAGAWHHVKLAFRGDAVTVTLDDKTWQETVKRPDFNTSKKKVLWLLNGGDMGIELDDIHVTPASGERGASAP